MNPGFKLFNAVCVSGAAPAAVPLPEPGGEAAGEPESEQEAGGGGGGGRGAGRGGRRRPHAAPGPDATGQRAAAEPEEDVRLRGLNVSHIRGTTVGTDR